MIRRTQFQASPLDNEEPLWKSIQRNEQEDAERLRELNEELGMVKISTVHTVNKIGENKIMSTKATRKTTNKTNGKSTAPKSPVVEPEVLPPTPKDYKLGRVDGAEQSLVSYDPKNTSLRLGNGATQIVKDIVNRTDEELVSMLQGLNLAENTVFVITGAACFEIIARAQKEGFKGQKVEGQGLIQFVAGVSQETGIDSNTLWKNYKIYEEFRVDLNEKLESAPEQILPKEFYLQALRVKDEPQKALSYFEEQRAAAGGSYYVAHAKRDAEKRLEGKTWAKIKQEDLKERVDAVKAKQIAKKVTQAAKGQTAQRLNMVTLQIAATEDNEWRMNQILEAEPSGFEAWFIRMCDERFGVPPIKEPEASLEQTVVPADFGA